MATIEQLFERAERAKARAAIAKADAQRLKAEADKARAAAQKAKAEEAQQRANVNRRMYEVMWGVTNPQKIGGDQRNRLVKALGMLGSKFDGEALSAGRKADRLRESLGMTWDELVGG